MNYEGLSRVELLRSIYDKMSDEEKKAFVLMHLNGRSNEEILRVLLTQGKQLTDIQRRVDQHTWLSDFGANVAGNAAYEAAIWFLRRLLKGLH